MDNFITETKVVPLESVQPNPWNPRKQDDFMFRKLVDSIKENGFIGAAVVREIGKDSYEIINGEHRWTACKELGYSKIKVESVGKMDDARAKLLTITLNNLEGEDDPIERGKLMLDIQKEAPQLMELLPFSADQIQTEIGLLDFDPSKEFKDNTKEIKEGTTYNITFAFKEKSDLDRLKDVLSNKEGSQEEALMEIIDDYDGKHPFEPEAEDSE